MIDLPVLTKSDAEASAEDNVRLWRSIEHLEQQQTYEAEHKAEFTEEAMAPATSSDRRDFLKVMAASMAMAGLTACRRPVERILPYSRKPEEVIPGIPMYYASAMPHAGVLHPVVVTSYEGRPQKIEGNPEHPMRASGASNVFQQATMLNMYDPDRSGVVIRDGELQDWDAFLSFVRGYQPSGTMAVLAPTVSSPTIARLRAEMERQFPGTMWVNWDAAGADNRSMGNQIAFGQPYRTVHRFSRAEVILALESDFLDGANPNSLWEGSEYSESRRIVTPEDSMSRLYMVESAYSLTGGMADHRLRLRPSQIGAFAAALAARLGVAEATPAAQQFAEHPWVDVLAEDLQSARGRSVVVAGGSQPAVVHALVARINDMLGNIGQTVELIDTGQAELTDQDEALGELVASMNGGSIETLLMLGTNPVYAAPASLNFRGAMERVANTIHAGLWADETASVSNWHLPLAHFVEAWGDGRSYDGTRSVIQPLISPLYDDAHSEIEILAAFLGINKSGYEIVRETWSSVIDGDFEKAWRLTLHDGFQAGTQYPVVTAPTRSIAEALATLPVIGEGIEVVVRPDGKVYDGTYSNNAWCQETPDSVTKITWDNVALMSPATASELGVGYEITKGKHYVDRVNIDIGNGPVDIPVWVAPGHADGVITVTMGYGRQLYSPRPHRETPFWDKDDELDVYGSGPLANGVGVSVTPLRPANGLVPVNASVTPAGGDRYMIATTQDHSSMVGRPIYRMATIDEFRENPTFAPDMVPPLTHHGEPLEPWEEYPALWEEDSPKYQDWYKDARYAENQWAMTIDLNACSGCSACIVACYSENNVQVVGKDQVSRGREMSWMRMDRYYTGEDMNNPGMVVMPMSCVHCENAPCESVCPVAATVHSPDGINVMVYNRCIGTRYCANNCPYKVRRFNFYNWTKNLPLQVQMTQNPNVTVRFRGVMEKCNYCVHRIRQANQQANIENRRLTDADVTPACQQACASDAIVFGDLNNPDSMINRTKASPRNYALLSELAVKPRSTYLARLRNPNPRLEAVDEPAA